MITPLIQHRVLTTPTLPPYVGPLYEYIVHGGGLMIRAERTHLTACIPVAAAEVRGLPVLDPAVHLALPRVPARALAWALAYAQAARNVQGHPQETLFHLSWGGVRWRLDVPPQTATATSVRPLETGPDSSYATALIELHSHHAMPAFWSDMDDRDERGFRIYAVLGTIFDQPILRVRIGCYGFRWELPADAIFELPAPVNARLRTVPTRYEEEEEGAIAA